MPIRFISRPVNADDFGDLENFRRSQKFRLFSARFAPKHLSETPVGSYFQAVKFNDDGSFYFHLPVPLIFCPLFIPRRLSN